MRRGERLSRYGRLELHELPPKLSKAATLVVKAIPREQGFSDLEKLFWLEHWELDDVKDLPLDRCYMGADSMAERLGISVSTVEDYRSKFLKRDLLVSFVRKGARNLGWVAILPPAAMPRSQVVADVAGKEAVRLAGILLQHIRARDEWARRASGESAGHGTLNPTAVGLGIRRG